MTWLQTYRIASVSKKKEDLTNHIITATATEVPNTPKDSKTSHEFHQQKKFNQKVQPRKYP